VANGRADILVASLKERVELDGLLRDEQTDDGKHGDAAVLGLGFAVVLHSLEVATVGKAKGVEVGDRSDRAREAPRELVSIGDPSVELGIERGGGLGNLAGGEGGSAGDKKGESDAELHGVRGMLSKILVGSNYAKKDTVDWILVGSDYRERYG
jgi:hypothetical protein